MNDELANKLEERTVVVGSIKNDVAEGGFFTTLEYKFRSEDKERAQELHEDNMKYISGQILGVDEPVSRWRMIYWAAIPVAILLSALAVLSAMGHEMQFNLFTFVSVLNLGLSIAAYIAAKQNEWN